MEYHEKNVQLQPQTALLYKINHKIYILVYIFIFNGNITIYKYAYTLIVK